MKRDEEEEVMVKICNQVLANTPIHQEPLGRAQYTAPRMFGYGAQMKRLEKHNSKFKQMMAPFQALTTGKMQNKWPSDVVDRSQGFPLDRAETRSCHVVLAKEQQPDSTTKLDVRQQEIATTASTPTTVGVDYAMQELPVPQVLQAFFLWVQGMIKYVPENTQIKAFNVAKSTICNVLTDIMVAIAVPPGLEADFAKPVIATSTQLMEHRDT